MRPFWRSCAIGLAVSTLMVSLYVADPMGQTQKFESMSLDLRFKYANHLLRPSDDIRIVAIDDQAVTQLEREYGRYPWPRRVFADLVDVLKEAGADRISLDLHFPEALRVLQLPEGSPQLQDSAVQDDERFAEAIARAGNVYLPMVFDVMPGRYDMGAIQRIGRQLAQQGAILTDQQYSELVGLPVPLLGADASLRGRIANLLRERFWLGDEAIAETLKVDLQAVRDWIGIVKRQVALELVSTQLRTDPQATADTICQALSQGAPAAARVSTDEVTWALDLVQRERIIHPNLPAVPQEDLSDLMQVRNPFQVQLPITPLARGTHGFGHVVFQRDPDGPVRRLPMLIHWNDRVVPQMALRVATDMLALQWGKATVSPEKITVPGTTRGGQEAIYTLFLDATGQTLVNWTMPGKEWRSCFAPVAAGAVLEVAQLRQTIRRNLAWLETRHLRMVQLIQPAELDRYRQLKEREQDALRRVAQSAPASQHRPGRWLQDDLERIRAEQRKIETACIDMLNMEVPNAPAASQGSAGNTLPEEAAEYVALYHQIARGELAADIARKNADLAARANQRLAQLRKDLAGKVVFVGCTAVGLDDIVSTPIWEESPGVMTHAQMLNAILRNRSIRPMDEGVNAGIVLACCVAMSIVASRLGPRESLAAMVAACAVFAALAMYVLFERMGIAIALATPVVGMFVTWAMITAYRQLVEERAKRLMTHTLQQYTSPALARRMAEDPETVTKAEAREVTCFFSDLKGFTTISEHLGADATQKVLNIYLECMTEVLDHSEALINKFLGDGIFAFYNPAIHPQEDHAERACLAAIDAMAALEQLKRQPQGATCQTLHMRIGLASGSAIVGNCGSERKFDYTCIGDTVNLASRLEGANKTFGTGILINARCRELLRGGLVCRYIGRVIVPGRAAYEDTYDLLGRREQVPMSTLERVERFEQAVRCYIAGNIGRARAEFEACLETDPADAASKFYVDLCEAQAFVPEGWTGTVEVVGK